ncbi:MULTISPECIES: sensor histidine kinase [unclassified Lentimonas]|uniref:sensor histidine kinase n=1 Tax=unclassified Lentimonas TaxID=2630993 RepID=UPI0013236780|nr:MULTISPECIES: ATP-binding protein [unclassified Lentimonas]CAA6692110.1 Unannotated [Lentimonas sp. CC19]CAA6694521.1 Unannotated [Lentimonas sp. CC10]CAA7070637.1 Unannotated [Lentimonas sp. CC11]
MSRRIRIRWRISVGVLGAIALLAVLIWVVFLDRQQVVPNIDQSISLYQIPNEIDLLEAEAQRIREEMALLPELKETLQNDRYGYHGGYLPALEELPEEPRWTVDVRFIVGAKMKQVILVPAMDRRFDQRNSYGFPRRFRISKLSPGRTPEVIQEWIDEDCPNPGRIPLIIDVDPDYPRGFRIEVFRGALESNRELFALDEVYGITINNEIIYARTGVKVSSSFESSPYWHEDFLIDHQTSLGLPLEAQQTSTVESTDVFLEFDSDEASYVTVEFDLGEVYDLSGILFYPASNRTGNWIPAFGFPGNIELFYGAPGSRRTAKIKRPSSVESDVSMQPGHNVLRLPLWGVDVNRLRVKFSDFPTSAGKSYFAMGEVVLLANKERHKLEAIRLVNGYELSQEDQHRLIDGKADGRVAMGHLEWIRQVQERDALSLRLTQVEELIGLLRERLHRFYWIFGVLLIAVTLVCAISLSLYLFLNRRESSRQLREQITLDLHDDIGSSLSAISLGLRRLRRYSSSGVMNASCDRLDSIIQRVQASFQDVLWFTNSDTDTLSELIAKLVQTAELRVPKEKLFIDLPVAEKDMDRKLKVMFKRDLLLIFSEAVNNAVKHSNATEIHVAFQWQKPHFTMTIYDNGEGFDLSAVQEQGGRPQIGLLSLQRRAKRLGGNYELQSQHGQGTHVSITLKL